MGSANESANESASESANGSTDESANESPNDLMVAMAQQCRELIEASLEQRSSLPRPLQPLHLLSMCDRIEQHAMEWPATKLHRWIGFIQCAMMANRMLDLDGAKAMFDQAKRAYRRISDDPDLLDHLDPESSFEIELGGQG